MTCPTSPYPSSKASPQYGDRDVRRGAAGHDTSVKVNAANPGYCATDFNGNSGFPAAVQDAEVVARFATLPDDGPNGIFWGDLSAVADSDEDTTSGVLAW